MKATFLGLILAALFLPASVVGQTTEFTYQGRLLFSGVAANGSFDFEFRLFDDALAGAQQGQALTLTAVNVNNGVFSVRLDFGDQFPGAARFLEIRVRQAGDELFSVLVPRQAITSAPYAIKSLNAENANVATNATQLGGVDASKYVSTADPRLTDSRSPSPGSANYIQNGTVQQPANFSISGTGSIGTKLIATFINSTSIGINNDTPAASLHIKVNAGNVLAGNAGCSGGFTGIGFAPSFTACANYSLLGNGVDTMVNRPNGGNIFFREANANQMMLAPGGNVGIGTTTPQQRLHVDGNEVLSTGFQSGFKFRDRGSTSANDDWVWYSSGNIARLFHAGVGDVLTVQTNGTLNISGSSTFSSNVLNAAAQYNIGGQRVLSATGATNTFVGLNAGNANTANDNSFFGNGAGRANTAGAENSFFGTAAGNSNTTGNANSFFGFAAGGFNTTAHDNSFSGWFAGQRNTTGSFNSFFGSQSGQNNTTANDNSFYGYAAGVNTTTGEANSFFGSGVGLLNTTGLRNTYFGSHAGESNQAGNENSFFGANAGSSNLASDNSFYGAQTGYSNTTGPFNSFFGNYSGWANTTGGSNSFFGSESGEANTTGFNNSFYGRNSGRRNITGALNSFFGNSAGLSNTTGTNNSFFGSGVGQANTTADDNSFFGGGAGFSNTIGFDNTFIGKDAGFKNIDGNGNTFIGVNNGLSNTSGGANTFVGFQAGQLNTTGALNLFVGDAAGDTNTTGSNNTVIGPLADVGSGALTFATAIGAGAVVTVSNTIQLGRTSGVDHVRVSGLGTAGTQQLCRNVLNEISACSSSLRYKSNVVSFTSGLDLIKRLRPVSFRWKDSGMFDLGLVAEEVNKLEPLLTTTNERGQIEGVKYDRLGVVLINSIKEQQDQIAEQQKQIEKQQRTIIRQELELQEQKQAFESLKTLVCLQNRRANVCRATDRHQVK